MPDFTDFDSVDDASTFNSGIINAGADTVNQAARETGGARNGMIATVAGDAAFGIMDLADTIASSIPGVSKAIGIKRGQVNNELLAAIDSPGLTAFYNQNKEGIAVASGITGAIAAEFAGRRIQQVLTPFVSGLRATTIGKRVLGMDRQYAEAMGTVRAVDTEIAKRGLTGGDVWAQTIGPVRSGVVTEAGPSVGVLFSGTRKTAANSAFAKAFGKGVTDAARTEATMATFLNQNEFLYSEDAGQNMMWMGLGVAAGGAFQVLGAGYQMRKFSNSDSLRRIKAQALDPTGQEKARIAIAELTGNKPFLGALRGTDSDKVTSYMVSAVAAPASGVDVPTFERLAVQHKQLAYENVGKVTAHGLPQEAGTAFGSGNADWFLHVTKGLDKDAGLLYGAEMVGGIGDGMTIRGVTTSVKNRIMDRLTSINDVLASHNLSLTPEAKKLQPKFEALQKEVADLTKKVPKALQQGTPGVKWTSDQAALFAKRSELSTLKKLRGTELTDEQRIAMLSELKNVKFMDELTPMVLVDQELMPLSHAQIYDDWVEPRVSQPSKTDDLFEAFHPDGRQANIAIDSTNGTMYFPKVGGVEGTMDTVDHLDALRMYRVGQDYVTDLAKKTVGGDLVWDIPTQMLNGKPVANWFHLDMAEELMQRTNGRAKVNWGNLSRETAQKESLIQKILALKQKNFADLEPADVQKLRLRYNLPRLNSYEMGVLGTSDTPLDSLIRGASSMPEDQLRALSLNDLKQGFAEMSNIGDFTKRTAADVKTLSGNSFQFQLVREGENLVPVKPVVVYKREIAPFDYAPDRLAERIAAKKTAQASMLVGGQSGPITRELVGEMMASPDFALGSEVAGLSDQQIASSIPGLANQASQTPIGSGRNAVVTAEMRARDNPAILAITRLRETIDRRMRGIMRQNIEGAFEDTLATLNGPRNAGSKVLLDNFHSFSPGWNLEKDAIQIGDKHGFVLADTQANRSRFKQQYGREMSQGQTLLDSRGQDVVLDKLGLDIQTRFNAVTESQRVEKNSILAAQGLPQIRNTPWYTPPANSQGKYVGFTFDANKEIIPGGTIVAPTQEAFDREVARMHADPKSVVNTSAGGIFRTQDDIKAYANLWDKAQMEMMNPGTTAIQGEKASFGKLVGPYINSNRFDDSMRSLRDQYLAHADDLMTIMLDDQIKAVKTRKAIAGGVTRNADNKQTNYRSIYDYWLMAAQGRNSLQGEGSAVGWLYNGIESAFDNTMRQAAPSANRVWAAVQDWTSAKMPFQTDAKSIKQFTQLRDQLGPHMPFESAADMLERKGLGANPWKLADLTGAGNRFTATWMLRMLEPAAAVMNLAGIVNAMPAVIRHVSAKEGETIGELANRIGHSATIFTSPEGRVFSTPDMGKIAQRGFKRAWNRASDAEYDYMMKNGYLSQEVAEFQKQFNAIDADGPVKEGLKKLVDRMSVLTDKSEDFSRSWGHMIGLEVADMSGITGQAARHNFAHDIANKMIANYSPLNRPEVFQGAVGAPIGLFQSFMVAYYQRMFRYVETGDVRALATQFAVQGSLFGGKTVPGFNEMNDLFFQNAEGEDSPYDSLYRKFGPNGGDLLTGGVLSNLPKLFGPQGVDLSSRADVSPRILTQNPVTNSAVAGTVTKTIPGAIKLIGAVKDAIGQGIGLWGQENPHVGGQQIAEIVSNMMPNRPLAGFVETALAHGYDTDGIGQVVSQTKTNMDAAYRMMGVRSMEQSKEIEAFYGNKQAQEIQAGKRDIYNTALRSTIRQKDYEAIPGIIQNYLEHDGDPRQVRRMLKSAYEAATKTRGERQLTKAISGKKMDQVDRLMQQGVSIGQDAATPETSQAWGVSDPMDAEAPLNSEDSDTMAYQVNQ